MWRHWIPFLVGLIAKMSISPAPILMPRIVNQPSRFNHSSTMSSASRVICVHSFLLHLRYGDIWNRNFFEPLNPVGQRVYRKFERHHLRLKDIPVVHGYADSEHLTVRHFWFSRTRES